MTPDEALMEITRLALQGTNQTDEPSKTPPKKIRAPPANSVGQLKIVVMFPVAASILSNCVPLKGTSQMDDPSNTPPAKVVAAFENPTGQAIKLLILGVEGIEGQSTLLGDR